MNSFKVVAVGIASFYRIRRITSLILLGMIVNVSGTLLLSVDV